MDLSGGHILLDAAAAFCRAPHPKPSHEPLVVARIARHEDAPQADADVVDGVLELRDAFLRKVGIAVRKRPTEVDAQLGIIVALGAEAGVAEPLTAAPVQLIHEIERSERAQSLEALDALAGVMA